MKLTPVERIPGRKPFNNNLTSTLKEFMKMKSAIVEIDPIKEGYKHTNSLQSSLKNASIQMVIKVVLR